MTLNILGTEYQILVKKYDEDKAFRRDHVNGYCNGSTKVICICDMKTYPEWENEPEEGLIDYQKTTLRHEIVHAFFNESGLASSSTHLNMPWTKNEEMIDWIALQGPKIYKAWQEAEAL